MRMTLDLNKDLTARFRAMQEKVSMESGADVVRDALQLYEFLLDLEISGAVFSVNNERVHLFKPGTVRKAPK